jgi:hypothetical protein
MSNRTRNLILLIVGVQFLMIVGLLALPNVVQAIPGRYRVALQERSPFLGRISEEVIAQVAPLATALPTPVGSGSQQVDLGALVAARPTTELLPTATVAPTETAVPDAVAETAVDLTPEPTQPPTATPAPTLTPTPEPLPDRVILPDMGVIKQSFNNCGPANLTQVLNWYGNPVTQEDSRLLFETQSRRPQRQPVADRRLCEPANPRLSGYRPLRRLTGDGETLPGCRVPGGHRKGLRSARTGWWGHYLTVYGYDDVRQELYSQDTYLGPWDGSGRTDSYAELIRYWQQFNYTFYVVYKPEQEDEVAAILGEEMFDDLKMWQYVASLADSEAKANPDDAIAWFNLGTALTRMGSLTGDQQYYQGGAQAYDKAREIGLPPRMLWYEFMPYLAYWKVGRGQDVLDLAEATLATQGGRNVEETYWYQGHVYLEMGRISDARQAYQAALAVNENFYPAQISLDYVNSLGG